MTTIKRYSLYVLMFNTVSLLGMRNIDAAINMDVQLIHDRIDAEHLGIDPTTCCRWFIGSITSYNKARYLPQKKVHKEIKKIESYLPMDQANYYSREVFRKLVAKHWYLNYLIQALIEEKVNEFKNVKGSTIDALHKPNFDNDFSGLKEKIYTDAKNKYCDYAQSDRYWASYRRSEGHEKLFSMYLWNNAFNNSRSEQNEHKALKNSNTTRLIKKGV